MSSDIRCVTCIDDDPSACDFDLDFSLRHPSGWIVEYFNGSVERFKFGQLPQDILDHIKNVDFRTYTEKGVSWYRFYWR